MFSKNDMLIMEEFVQVTNEMEQLKKKSKELSKQIINSFNAEKVNSCMAAGNKIVLATTERTSFKKDMKDKFIADMNAIGKSHLIKINVDVDKDTLKADLATGLITENELSKYLTFSETKTLKVE